MSLLEDFNDILQHDKPLAPLTWMNLGGPAQFFLEPRNQAELQAVVICCHENGIPIHVLGGGSNLLIRDEGVSGAVIRLANASFAELTLDGTTLRAGSGALLSQAISISVRAGLAGLEVLAGIPGTVGGALKGNAGGRSGEISETARSVTTLTAKGEVITRTGDDLSFVYRSSNITEPFILEGTFQLRADDPDEITTRMRKLWIMKKATQPLSDQSAGCIFKNPRGQSAGALIDQAGLKGTRMGGAEISDRHANFVVTHAGCKSEDVLRLVDLVRSKIAEQFGVELELEIQVW
ncbi:MAG: UDP-N-acetylmuramate dehydrogenase [Planctomycetaceae bacterium]